MKQSIKDGYARHTKKRILQVLGQLRLRAVTVGRVEAPKGLLDGTANDSLGRVRACVDPAEMEFSTGCSK